MRIAFLMTLAPEHAVEYRARHNPIWPELEETLLQHGVRSYSIFLDPATGRLFACAEVADFAAWEAIARTDVCQRWWRYMAPLMDVNEDYSPKSTGLEEVFHIEAAAR
jgi:L-rhamnose mutarotase